MATRRPLLCFGPGRFPLIFTTDSLFSTARFFTVTTTTTTGSIKTSPQTQTPAGAAPILTCSSMPKYSLQLTPSKQLPIYHVVKSGGNKKLTTIKKVVGDITAMRDELRSTLKLEEGECIINQLTGHIIVKGHRRRDIVTFLSATQQKP